MFSFSHAVAASAVVVGSLSYHGWSVSKSADIELIGVLERQLSRCGPENLRCPTASVVYECTFKEQFSTILLSSLVGVNLVAFVMISRRFDSSA